jgi:hypothetical protein
VDFNALTDGVEALDFGKLGAKSKRKGKAVAAKKNEQDEDDNDIDADASNSRKTGTIPTNVHQYVKPNPRTTRPQRTNLTVEGTNSTNDEDVHDIRKSKATVAEKINKSDGEADGSGQESD